MIGKNTLKKYGFEHIQDYFYYIVESQINGQFKQSKELFKKLNESQKIKFFEWLKVSDYKFNYGALL